MSDATDEAEGQKPWAEEVAGMARLFDGTAGLFGVSWAELAVMDRPSVIVMALEETPIQQRGGFKGQMISSQEAQNVIERARGIMRTRAATAAVERAGVVAETTATAVVTSEEEFHGHPGPQEAEEVDVIAAQTQSFFHPPGADRPVEMRKMLVRRIPPAVFDRGPLAGIVTTIWTTKGIPICQLVDERLNAGGPPVDGNRGPLEPDGTHPEGQLEPIPDRMIALHWQEGREAGPTPGEPLWIGVGDGWAVPLPNGMPVVFLPALLEWLKGRTGAHGGGFTSADDVRDALAHEFGVKAASGG